MQTRHRVPTIFNLSMVDVLCCALGCVILLWLLNLREARDKAEAVGQTVERLSATQTQLDQALAQVKTLTAERADLTAQRDRLTKERDHVVQELTAARNQLADVDKRITAVESTLAQTQDQLTTLSEQKRTLAQEKADAAQRLRALQALLREKEGQAKTSSQRAEDLADQLAAAEANARKLQADMQKYRAQADLAESRARSLEAAAGDQKKELLEAARNAEALTKERAALAEQVNRAKAAYENRFEGIQLTGRRVVFLVDMSGSMELVDERTPDANKWVGVRETLAKVMRSLPSLEKYQVILFSDKVRYLLGGDGSWLDYDSKVPDRVLQAMIATKPVGATNMYDAFEAAFRFRPTGLDTIYVLSDGLPNTGPGLTPEQNATLTRETDRSEILARYIRNLLRRDWNREQPGRPRVHINTIGFFYESPDVGAFLWALARENDGSFVGMSKP